MLSLERFMAGLYISMISDTISQTTDLTQTTATPLCPVCHHHRDSGMPTTHFTDKTLFNLQRPPPAWALTSISWEMSRLSVSKQNGFLHFRNWQLIIAEKPSSFFVLVKLIYQTKWRGKLLFKNDRNSDSGKNRNQKLARYDFKLSFLFIFKTNL